MSTIAFGPIPSRRLGRSLGVNNIPPTMCTYACNYCQLGPAIHVDVKRQSFYDPVQLFDEVSSKVSQLRGVGESVDFLSFVPNGEPTLDENLGDEIDRLKSLGIPIAVISNGSLVWREDVRDDLDRADLVSLKIDSTREEVWRRINHPHRSLRLDAILEGIEIFTRSFRSKLLTETMLVAGINDGEDQLKETAAFIGSLKPAYAYLSVPTRPPSRAWVTPPDEETINRAYHVYRETIDNVECLTGHEGGSFFFTGNVEEDLLGTTSVHPMRADAVGELLGRADADWSVVQALVDSGELVETTHQGVKFYIRKVRRRQQE
jgi:wyosine [tRNA(Phe)-imidazoG37] synthetase (radical SAM superfamily)